MPISRSGKFYAQMSTRTFDQYLDDKGLREDVGIAAEKMYIAYQLEQARVEQKITKASLAKQLGTSRAQIDRVLDNHNQNVTIETLKRVAALLGKRLKLELI
jgi:antitoxin HicB